MNDSTFYLNCDNPGTGYRPINFSQGVTPKTTHTLKFSDLLLITDDTPTDTSYFGEWFVYPRFCSPLVVGVFNGRGYQPVTLRLRHQVYKEAVADFPRGLPFFAAIQPYTPTDLK